MVHSSDSYKGFSSIAANNLGGGVIRRASGCVSASQDEIELVTPCSNTELNGQGGLDDQKMPVGIDYLTLIVPIESFEDVSTILEMIENIYLDSFEIFLDAGMFTGRQFAHRAKSACGASAIWNLPGQNSDKGSMRIALSGEILKRAQQMQSVRFMAYCSRLGAICNRLDLKADDYSRSMHPDLLQAACDAGNVKGFRKSTIHRDMYQFDVFESGWTLYFGSRTSDRFTRYYNAKPLHEIEAWRFECEFKHSIANEIMNHLILCIDDEELLIRMIASNIAGNISFIDRSDEPRANRCYELSWWERFTDRLGSSIRLSLPKIVPTIQKSINWIENKVSASLAMVAQYYGTDKIEYIKKLIQRGEHKLTNRHQAILDTSPIAMRILL